MMKHAEKADTGTGRENRENRENMSSGMEANKAKPGVRMILLRLLSSLAVNMYVYSGFAFIRTILFYDDGGFTSVMLYACSILPAYLAGSLLNSKTPYFAGRLAGTKAFRFIAYALGIRRMDRTIATLTSWFIIVVPAAAVIMFHWEYGVLKLLYESAAVCCAYIITLKHTQMAPADIMSDGSLYAGLFILGVCLELPFLIDRLAYLRPWFFGALYFLIFIYLVVRNQEDIDENIYEKKYVEKSVLPKNLRRFNTVSVIFVFLVILILSNFRAVVSKLLYLAGRLIGIVVGAFFWLLDQISTDTVVTEGGSMSEPVAPALMDVKPPSPYMNLIFNILQYSVVLYLTYKLAWVIIKNIPAIAAKLADMLKKLFRIKKSKGDYVESDYVDVTETVLPQKKEPAARSRGRGKRTARQLRKIKDPAERIRYMYGLILDMLPVRGIRPRSTDTTGEILVRASCAEDLNSLHPFTEIYDRVRYGGTVPDKETLTRAEAYYSKASEAIKGRST